MLTKAGPGRLIGALAAVAIAAALFLTLALRMGGEEKTLLFSNLSLSEAQEISARLEQSKIDYKLASDGSAIFVARSEVLDARMMLSADGLPTRGSVGYELFDKQDALGATQFQQNINRLRALEGELGRTIVSLDGVQSARVHLVLPERQLFERNKQEPSASIVLKLSADLTSGQVRGVRNLVAGAVPGLSPQRVTILDEQGRLLAAGAGDTETAIAEEADSRQAATEERIRKTVQDIVESVVGMGGARVQVRADMDFNRITQATETFDPEGRVVRSTQTVEEKSDEAGRDSGASSAGRNVPDGAGSSGGGGGRNTDNRTEETVNYEISKTNKTEIIEGGRIKRLSVAVAVDGVSTPGAQGAPAQWKPRDPGEMERISALVKSAMGFDEARGDQVEVVNVRFAKPEALGSEVKKPGLMNFQTSDIMRLGEIGAALVAALAVIFFVLRPMASGLFKPAPAQIAHSGQRSLASSDGQLSLPVPSGATNEELAPIQRELDIAQDVARIRGEVKASSMKQVTEVIQQHPDESVAIIRGWLNNIG